MQKLFCELPTGSYFTFKARKDWIKVVLYSSPDVVKYQNVTIVEGEKIPFGEIIYIYFTKDAFRFPVEIVE